MTTTLVLGGARSGKSAHAEGLLIADAVDYLATARRDRSDAEWEARINAHVERRPANWRTVETAEVADWLRGARRPVLVDDIATWLTGELDDAHAWDGGPDARAMVRSRGDDLVAAVATSAVDTVLVSAEVGLGVVPETSAGRLFRDELGRLNAELARVCTHVSLLMAGIVLRLK